MCIHQHIIESMNNCNDLSSNYQTWTWDSHASIGSIIYRDLEITLLVVVNIEYCVHGGMWGVLIVSKRS